MAEKVYPFSCGSQYVDWQARNCERCVKYNEEQFDGSCDLDLAIGVAYIGDGSVTRAVADRLGYVAGVAFTDAGFAYTWDCPERVARDD